MNIIEKIHFPPPEWLIYPHLPLGSLGWRMWYGEGYLEFLHDFLDTLSIEERRKYYNFFPLPDFWSANMEDISNGIFSQDRWNPKYYMGILLFSESFTTSYNFENIKIDKNDIRIAPENPLSKEFFIDFSMGVSDFISLEHFVLYQKWMYFHDREFSNFVWNIKKRKILQENLHRLPKNFDDTKWKKVEYFAFLSWNYFKLTQNMELLDEVFASIGKAYFVDENDEKNNFLWFSLYEAWVLLKEIYKNYNRIDWEKLEEKNILIPKFHKKFLKNI